MFQFKLQKILDFKLAQESDRKHQLGQAYLLQQQEQARLEQFRQQKQKEQVPVRGKIDIFSLMQRQQFLTNMDEKIAGQQEKLNEAEQLVKQKRAEVIDAMQERKVLDKLKERKEEEYNFEVGIKEQKVLDEAATASFVRRGS